jgi:hypothetical protein
MSLSAATAKPAAFRPNRLCELPEPNDWSCPATERLTPNPTFGRCTQTQPFFDANFSALDHKPSIADFLLEFRQENNTLRQLWGR